MRDDGDPGWPGPGDLMWLFLPRVGAARLARRDGGPLLQTRLLALSFASSICLFQVVLVFLMSGSRQATGSEGVAALFVVVILVAGMVALVARRFERPLDCATDVTLIVSYRTRFFTRVALAEAPALLAFVGTFVTWQVWMYPLGLVIGLALMVRGAPTRGQLRRDQRQLDASGCARGLVPAFTHPRIGGS